MKLTLTLLFALAPLKAMELAKTTPNKKTHDLYVIVDGTYTLEKYDHYYCSFNESIKCNDEIKNVRMPSNLFMHLVIQASKRAQKINVQSKPFAKLLQKLKQNKITSCTYDDENPTIELTEKDLRYRLLSYIKRGHQYAKINSQPMILHETMVTDDQATWTTIQTSIDVAHYQNHPHIVNKYNKLIGIKNKDI